MRRRLECLFLLLCVLSLAAGCHWFRFGRKKRSTAAEAQLTEIWRSYFALCLGAKVAADPSLATTANTQNWQSNVDYSILQSVWYINVDQWHCSSAAGQDTAQCWKGFLAQYLRTGSAVLTYSQTCVDEFVEDTQSNPPTFRYFPQTRKKRGLSYPFPTNTPEPPTSSANPQQGYTSCLRSNGGQIAGTDPLDYESVSQFVRDYTVFGCEACGDACAEQATLPPNAPPQWPYRFLALSRNDAPIRNAISECNDVFFPGGPFWSEWSPYTPDSCPVCGSGTTQVRSRTCRSGVDPTRPVDNSQCGGSDSERIVCQIPACLPPAWSNWSPWTSCPVCGEGFFQSRERVCRSQFGGTLSHSECFGSVSEHRGCNIRPCEPNIWGQWQNWNPPCPRCGQSPMQTRTRTCYAPRFTEILSASECPGGAGEQNRNCPIQSCANWGNWGRWGPPCPSCARGPTEQTRRRVCRSIFYQQLPKSQCTGSGVDTRLCDVLQCDPVGEWSNWGDWDVCTSQCSRKRARTCIPPNAICRGQSDQSQSCSGELCQGNLQPIIPYWGPWSNWGGCNGCDTSVGGMRNRTRSCLYYFVVTVPDSLCSLFPGGSTHTASCNNCRP